MQRNNTIASCRIGTKRRATIFSVAFFVGLLAASTSFAAISVGTLTKDTAKNKYGITMHSMQNGDAGVKVWLEFKQEGWLEKFTYAELRVTNAEGKHLISAMLKPNPVHHRQSKGVTTVSFSADSDQLKQCRFLVVCYNSNEGDVGYYLNVKDFLDLEHPVTEPQNGG